MLTTLAIVPLICSVVVFALTFLDDHSSRVDISCSKYVLEMEVRHRQVISGIKSDQRWEAMHTARQAWRRVVCGVQ